MTYLVFKFLHIVGASAWVGGIILMSVLDTLLISADSVARRPMARQNERVRRIVLGPSAMLTLVAGGVAMYLSGVGFALWIVWGLAAVVLSIVIGATMGRRIVLMLSRVEQSVPASDQHYQVLQRRLVTLDLVVVLIMLSTVAMMVWRPA